MSLHFFSLRFLIRIMKLTNFHHGIGISLGCGVWALPFLLALYSLCQDEKIMDHDRHRPGTQQEPERTRTRFPGCAPGKEVCAGSHPPAGPAQETRRESQEPGLPGPAAPPRLPPRLPRTAGSRPAGTPCSAGGNGLAGFPGPRRRGAVTAAGTPPPPPPALSLQSVHQDHSEAPQPRSRRPSRAARVPRAPAPTRHAAHVAGGRTGKGEVAEPFFAEVRR